VLPGAGIPRRSRGSHCTRCCRTTGWPCSQARSPVVGS